jgi:hypothetical protein
MDPKIFDEIRFLYSGTIPNAFLRMDEAGVLDGYWPKFRAAIAGPLPTAVVDAMFVVFSARCGDAYCFVFHSLSLLTLGASVIAIEELERLFDMPAIVAEHERWSRVLKLAWLAEFDESQQTAADFMLRRICSDDEYAQIMSLRAVAVEIADFIAVHGVTLEHDPSFAQVLAQVPEEFRGLVPTFVQFHSRMNPSDPEQRPVAVMCSMCREIRSTDGEWYPFEFARSLLGADVLFSHGLCDGCLNP